jgi:acetolactate synthase I/II/III large subunit
MNAPSRVCGSEATVLSLIEENVPYIFGYPGGAIMPIYDALMSHQGRIKHILTRHEQGAVHAAQGYARVTGDVGVCMATSGPGATNLVTGIADAMIDSTPIVCITGQVASPLLGSDAFQESDVVGISMPVTKWNYLVTRPDEIPWALSTAFYIARTGRPGPVLVDIAKDAQFGELDFQYEKKTYIRSYTPKPAIDDAQIEKASQMINGAKKPYVLFGQGVILGNAEAELVAFLEKSGIPAAWTILGASALPSAHPLNMGMLGMHGNYSTNLLSSECDAIIAVGMRFDDRVTGDLSRYAPQATVIHLEIDPAEVNKNVPVDIAVIGDVKDTLPRLTALVEQRDLSSWVAAFRKLEAVERERVIEKDLFPTKAGLTNGEVIRRINEQTGDDAVVVTDVGQHQMFASRYCRYKRTRSFITSGGLGTMGYGLPASLGAKIGAPERHVICMVGDGGIQMTIQELGTLKQTGAAVKIVLFNNNYLGMVRQWQELFFDRRYSETYLENPDFVKVAEGYGIKGRKVTKRDELDGAVEEMLAHDAPYLLEVEIEKEDNVFPMIPAGAAVTEIMLEPNNKK